MYLPSHGVIIRLADSVCSQDEDLIHFLHTLRGMMRSASALCFISFPAHLHSTSLFKRVQHLCDTVVSIQSFQGKRGMCLCVLVSDQSRSSVQQARACSHTHTHSFFTFSAHSSVNITFFY